MLSSFMYISWRELLTEYFKSLVAILSTGMEPQCNHTCRTWWQMDDWACGLFVLMALCCFALRIDYKRWCRDSAKENMRKTCLDHLINLPYCWNSQGRWAWGEKFTFVALPRNEWIGASTWGISTYNMVYIRNPALPHRNTCASPRGAHTEYPNPQHTPSGDERCKPDTPSNSPLPSSTPGNLRRLRNWSASQDETSSHFQNPDFRCFRASKITPSFNTNLWAQKINSMGLECVMTRIDCGCGDTLDADHMEQLGWRGWRGVIPWNGFIVECDELPTFLLQKPL